MQEKTVKAVKAGAFPKSCVNITRKFPGDFSGLLVLGFCVVCGRGQGIRNPHCPRQSRQSRQFIDLEGSAQFGKNVPENVFTLLALDFDKE